MVVYMTGNERLIRDLLQTITDNEPAEVLSAYWHPEGEQVELPSLMRPDGHTRKLAEMLEAYRAGAGFLLWQQYDIDNVVDDGEQVAVQLRWTATTAVDAGALPAGTELVAHVAIFYQFRDGKILRQSSYDCYEPIKAAG
jgi:ketosteroid isomerase-like protein